jgi:hypothetical protein
MPNVGKIGVGHPISGGCWLGENEVGKAEEGLSRVETYLDSLNLSDIVEFCDEEGRGRTYDSLPVGRKAGNTRMATARESLHARATPVIACSISSFTVEN